MRIHYYGHQSKETGYGRAAREYIDALDLVDDAEIKAFPLVEVRGGFPHNDDVNVFHGTPAQLEELVKFGLPSVVKNVALTTWETSFLPESLARALSAYDLIIVPSRFCQSVIEPTMSAIGGNRFQVVPHCYDPNDWKIRRRDPDRPFTFYSIGAFSERKNVMGVLKAYLHAFTKADKTRLVIIAEGVQFEAIKMLLKLSNVPEDELPALLVPDQALTQAEIIKLHQESDCFVSATRAEGFGLGMFEAAIMGNHVIAPGYGGQEEFLSEHAFWWPVRFQMTPVFGGGPRGANAHQLWADPDLSHLSRLMRTVREERPRDREFSRERFDDLYSTPVVGQRFYDVLKELRG